MDRLGPKKQILDQSGQSAVEYLLLLAVVMSFAGFVFKTDFWQSYFGPQGKFDEVFRGKIEYSYRHSLGGDAFYSQPNYTNKNHDSYFFGGNSRFYRPNDEYPKE